MSSGEPRYRIETLDRVLCDNDCDAQTDQINKRTRGWIRKTATDLDGIPTLARYTPEDGTMSVPYNVVVTLAIQLQLDPEKIVRELERAGGLLPGP